MKSLCNKDLTTSETISTDALAASPTASATVLAASAIVLQASEIKSNNPMSSPLIILQLHRIHNFNLNTVFL